MDSDCYLNIKHFQIYMVYLMLKWVCGLSATRIIFIIVKDLAGIPIIWIYWYSTSPPPPFTTLIGYCLCYLGYHYNERSYRPLFVTIISFVGSLNLIHSSPSSKATSRVLSVGSPFARPLLNVWKSEKLLYMGIRWRSERGWEMWKEERERERERECELYNWVKNGFTRRTIRRIVQKYLRRLNRGNI